METAGVGGCPALRDVLPDKASLALAPAPLYLPLLTHSPRRDTFFLNLTYSFRIFMRRVRAQLTVNSSNAYM